MPAVWHRRIQRQDTSFSVQFVPEIWVLVFDFALSVLPAEQRTCGIRGSFWHRSWLHDFDVEVQVQSVFKLLSSSRLLDRSE